MKNVRIRIVCLAAFTAVCCGWTVWNLSAETTTAKATSKPESVSAVIAMLEQRIRQLEDVQDMSSRISREAGSSVGLIVGQYIWTDRTGRKPLRYQGVDENGNLLQDKAGHESVSFDGDGPIVTRDFQGTGFLIDPTHVLTSGFILAPWETDPLLDTSENPELVPSIRMLHVYFPGVMKAIDLKIDRAAESQDAVVCSLAASVPSHNVAVNNSEQLSTGEPILLLGYPGGVDMLTSRVPDDVRRDIYKYGQPDLDEAAQLLAERGYIKPIAMQSRISGQTENRIFFETFSNYGSTGGPLLNSQGQVVALNQSIYPAYPSFNMAITLAPMKSWIAHTVPESGQAF